MKLRIQSGAIYYSIIVIVFITLIVLFFIINSSLARYRVLQVIKYEQAQLNLQSAINMALTDHQADFNRNWFSIYKINNQNIHVEIKQWGFLKIAIATSNYNNSNISLCLSLGYKKDSLPVLYLIEKNQSLNVGGNVIIKGNCFLPHKGIQKINIEGSYDENTVLFGKSSFSDKTLPELNESFVNTILNYFNIDIFKYESDSLILSNNIPDKMNNSFKNKTLVFYSNNTLSLRNKEIKNNVIIYSNDTIIIDNTFETDNILCIAKNVVIKDNFEGCIQVAASESIIVGDNCTFNYPSALMIIEHRFKNSYIYAGNNFYINGALILYSENNESNGIINIAENANIEGVIYSKGLINFKNNSIVIGHVFTGGFLLYTSLGSYKNALKNVKIDAISVPDDYIYPQIFKMSKYAIIEKLE